MKLVKTASLFALSMVFSVAVMAQKATTETIPVAGNCGMCKTKIEKAAKEAGASKADWNAETKTLTVSYKNKSTNAAKIQEGIAAVGYDTRDVKATDAAYDKLHGCCKYERKDMKAQEAKNADGITKTEAACCKKEGATASTKETKEKSCCSDGKAH